LEITTSPHLDLPLGGVVDVVVTAGPSPEPPAFGQPSFSISSSGGQLLVAYVNELDHAPAVPTEPIVFTVTPSGCPGVDMAVICDAGGSLLVQRRAVEFGNGVVPIVLFDGNHGIVPGNADDYSVIVGEAAAITCWDDDCAADDSGPSDRLEMFAVLLPSA
jgi:hypothetical protein